MPDLAPGSGTRRGTAGAGGGSPARPSRPRRCPGSCSSPCAAPAHTTFRQHPHLRAVCMHANNAGLYRTNIDPPAAIVNSNSCHTITAAYVRRCMQVVCGMPQARAHRQVRQCMPFSNADGGAKDASARLFRLGARHGGADEAADARLQLPGSCAHAAHHRCRVADPLLLRVLLRYKRWRRLLLGRWRRDGDLPTRRSEYLSCMHEQNTCSMT